MTEIVITVADGGKSEIAVNGCSGPSCSNLTKAFEEALGTVERDQKLPEFFHAAKQGQNLKAGAK